MHLKRITVAGFKSFADRISLTFDRGITGIVGPNGSGKSNVIDAVRWVMGEQNAKNLRGEKATDIIFAGSDRRKALATAEVSLTFDNTSDDGFCPPEYRHEPEITLTRRLYIDGQREYLINRKPCRLKDIVGFFAMTGLGGRSYSMIQQGQVDRILNAKPEDVREILEEAAGTLLFKQRRQEAQKKLEATQLNLSRVTDILGELERQQVSLKDQVEKASKWQDLSTELRQEELLLFGHNFTHFDTKQRELAGQIAEEMSKEAATLSELASLESRHAELQQILNDADPELAALNETYAVIREQIARSEAQIGNCLHRRDAGEQRLAAIARELTEDQENVKVLESQFENSSNELRAAETEAERLRSLIENFQDEVDSVDESVRVYETRVAEHEDEQKNLTRLIDSNRYRTESLARDLEKTRRSKEEQHARLIQLEEDHAQAMHLVAFAEEKAAGRKEGLDVEIREKHSREATVAQRYAQIKDANVRRDAHRERYHEAKARITSLTEATTGATDVASAVVELKEKIPATAECIRGLLTDYIALNERASELPKSLLQAFERWSERLVLDDLNALNNLIQLTQKTGTSYALPIAVLSLSEPVDKAQAESWANKHGAEPFAAYLKIDTRLGGMSNLTDRLWYLPALQMSDELFTDLPKGLVVFTARGVSFTGDDEFIIGSRGAAGLLSRKSEKEQLERELKKLEGELSRCQTEIDELEVRINEDRAVIADIDTRLQAQNQDVLAVMSELQSAQQMADHKQELLVSVRKTLDELTAQETGFCKESADLEATRESLQVELNTIETEIASLKAESSSLDERRDEVMRQHQQRQLDMAKSQARAHTLKDSWVHTKAQMELLQNKLSRRWEEQNSIQHDLEIAKQQLEEAQRDVETNVMRRDELEDKLALKREENAGTHEELRVVDGKLRQLRDIQSRVQKIVADKNVAIERAKIGMSSVIEQAQEKYQVDIRTWTFAFNPEFNIEKSSRLVSSLRSKIEALGPVNMMAMQEHTELNQREKFIRGQQDEIIASLNLLGDAIAEIETTSKEKFLNIFQVINAEFGKLFPILFPGGEAHLEMTNPEDPLNAGVEIMVRLPGKKHQRMSLFSGGEKALTAIALIFALLKTKPTPFCFLDEVDAPLDEANVGRYNRVLEALSAQFQFVVITHNRRTMEVLDTLYGVTMQEPGVSSVVGVDMKQDLPPHLKKAFKEEGAAGKVPPAATIKAREISGAQTL
jgi:chromosome segregation protein